MRTLYSYTQLQKLMNIHIHRHLYTHVSPHVPILPLLVCLREPLSPNTTEYKLKTATRVLFLIMTGSRVVYYAAMIMAV